MSNPSEFKTVPSAQSSAQVQSPSEPQGPLILQVHHVDGNIENHSLDNLRLACSHCNTLEYWKLAGKLERKKSRRTLRGLALRMRYQDLVKRDRDACWYCKKPGKVMADSVQVEREKRREISVGQPASLPAIALTVTADSAPFANASEFSTQKNDKVKPAFRKWVIDICRRLGPGEWYPWSALEEDGAETFDVETVTTGRYLRRLTSNPGPCQREKRLTGDGKKAEWFVRLKREFYSQAARSTTSPSDATGEAQP